jgi:transcription antitermination protein NusB
MISRRILRIKILQILYAYYSSDNPSINKFEKELNFSIIKTFDLYHYIFVLLQDVVRYAESRIELAKAKNLPTLEDLNPNTKFIDNLIIKQISENEQFNKYISATKLSWVNHPEMIKNLFLMIKDSPDFIAYMNNPERDYSQDKDLIISLLENEVYNFQMFYQALEEQSIYWNDDVDFVISMVIKTIKGFKKDDMAETKLMSLYKNDEDRLFAINLYRKAVLNDDEYRKMVEKFIQNWDIERIAFMDIIIMQVAIAELIEFPSIPTKVTLNEYIEISKLYSTPKSGTFINGVLDKIILYLKDENLIQKLGRGLVGEV